MSVDLLVVKLGGDALATPAAIAAAATRVAAERIAHSVVVVTSARRGMTDHLMDLTRAVDRAAGEHADERPWPVASDRAVAAGEVVTAALLAAALERRGCPALALDAREAGLLGDGPPGAARLRRIRVGRLRRVLARGVVPVVTGFQVAERGTIRILGRGGSDLSAVAIAAALGATACAFYKLHGLRLDDPAILPDAPHAGRIDHAALARLLAAGSRVLHPGAARLAARHRLPLAFVPFPEPGEVSWVE